MANLCDTQYKITGEKKAVADLWNTLQEMNVNEKNIWLGDLANHYGIDYKAKGFSVRGESIGRNMKNIVTMLCCRLTRKRLGLLATTSSMR